MQSFVRVGYSSSTNSRDLTLKHMFDITLKLVSEQDEINNLDKIHWGRNSWNSPQGIWDHIAEKMLLEFAESGCPIFRATTPLSRGKLKSKGHGKLSIHYCADQKTIETMFRIIAFANQLSLYGAVANMCEEFESLQDRSGQPDALMGQSIVLSEIKAEVPLEIDIPSHQNLLLQRHEERIKLLSQENKVSKFCMDAGFIHVVEV